MLNSKLKLNENCLGRSPVLASQRDGFGQSLLELGGQNSNIVVLAADLKNSVKVGKFATEFKDRFIQVGIAEQNMAGIAAGLAFSGKIPFMVSHGAFSPYRNWDQIRLSICYPKANVKIAASHTGFSNGPDGASAQPLEDIAIMRALPNMVVINPIDAIQIKRAIEESLKIKGPCYIRFSKAETQIITTDKTPFGVGVADILIEGRDVTLVSCGPIIYEALIAAKNLKAKYKIEVEIVSSPTIKPLDEKTILKSAKKTGRVITLEEHQINGGLGSAVAELLSEELPTPLLRIGVEDKFGESGSYKHLKDKYGLSSHVIEEKVVSFLKGFKS